MSVEESNLRKQLDALQARIDELEAENKYLRERAPHDPLVALIYEAGKIVYKTQPTKKSAEAISRLSRNGVKDIDSLMNVSLIEAVKWYSVGPMVVSIIAVAQEIQRKRQQNEGMA